MTEIVITDDGESEAYIKVSTTHQRVGMVRDFSLCPTEMKEIKEMVITDDFLWVTQKV